MTPKCLAVFALSGLWMVTAAGCAGTKPQVPLEVAESSVHTALDSWKSGEKADQLKTRTPPIEFHDDDWQKAARLVEYELIKTYCDTDGFPRCTVALTLQHSGQEPVRLQVTYQVVMKPNVVIARDPFS